jgi:predicted peroxiredoxin
VYPQGQILASAFVYLNILHRHCEWGPNAPTEAAFPFLQGNALAEAGHQAQIFLLGEAVSLIRAWVADSVIPIGWPPLAETLQKTIALGIPIHV